MLPLLPLRTGQALSALGLCPACLFCQEHPPPTPAVPSELLHCPQSPIALYPSQRSGELMPQLQGTRSPCHPLCLLPRLGKGLGMLRTGRVKVSPWSCCASPTSPGTLPKAVLPDWEEVGSGSDCFCWNSSCAVSSCPRVLALSALASVLPSVTSGS